MLGRLLEENVLASSHLIALEVLYSARNLAEYRELAAAAELNDAVLLHYDSDFDRIAEVTGQRARWIVQRGSAGPAT